MPLTRFDQCQYHGGVICIYFITNCSYVFQVNNNGNLSPGEAFLEYLPRMFPFDSSATIAVFWADSDTRPDGSGEVWYRASTTTTLVQKAKTDIKKAYPSVSDVEYIFIATWNSIGYFDRNTNKVTDRLEHHFEREISNKYKEAHLLLRVRAAS